MVIIYASFTIKFSIIMTQLCVIINYFYIYKLCFHCFRVTVDLLDNIITEHFNRYFHVVLDYNITL